MVRVADLSLLDHAAKDKLIHALLAEIGTLHARIEKQDARIAALEAKLGEPPKTPDNSSLPPSRGQKPSPDPGLAKDKRKAHPGAHRPLHPDPTARCDGVFLPALRRRCRREAAMRPRGL